ncbi:MAG: DEAD/DEAH box helicase [Candidatus Lambdaproteobacteria bacterium RIFOXYD2_FULL_50_16]|uniref:DEAD-box ATP-dependent RNA helicase RhpA n=1 Tax=Candidatus Lambdaproteobacteria bacterium RIFOXYD2_FULL_50_16 TaxID=1817772 RepID=A0A1F6GAF7_9PROT|nr:MAG: DEAD/DEAH box helicase [Candidatus Lambdaproteobacteria bacterium RIFOXYD2_FULL_50_16]
MGPNLRKNLSTFKDLGLFPEILKNLEQAGYQTPTPIQSQAIPQLLQKKDLLGIAQTGTGKTAAFSLPILHHFASEPLKVGPGKARALILAPTRELVTQIAQNLEAYSVNLGFKMAVIYGGVNQNPQIRSMLRGADLLVATPGRLMDLMNQGQVNLSQVEVFVLDEADRMLDMGFINDIRKIERTLPKKRQTMLFSATMPKSIASLAASLLNNPVRVEVNPESTTVDRINQQLVRVDKKEKPNLLRSILEESGAARVLVFSRTKYGADRVARDLQKHQISSAAIHGNKTQAAREKSLNHFKEGRIQVLVATDIAARGIDVDSVSHVINYDLPQDPESYVHRIGRTARAGREGIAISFCDQTEHDQLEAIEKLIKKKLPLHAVYSSPVPDEMIKKANLVTPAFRPARHERPAPQTAKKPAAEPAVVHPSEMRPGRRLKKTTATTLAHRGTRHH